MTLVTDAKAAPPSLGVRLLSDLYTVFTDSGEDYIFTEDVLTGLVEIDDAPWSDIRGKALDARSLARRLHQVRHQTSNGQDRRQDVKGLRPRRPGRRLVPICDACDGCDGRQRAKPTHCDGWAYT